MFFRSCRRLGFLLLALMGSVQAAAPGLGELMKTVVTPASDSVFAAAGDTPQDAAAWRQVAIAGQTLQAVGGRLQRQPATAADWQRWSKAFTAASRAAVQAAQRQDGAALAQAGDALYATCDACHQRYLPRPAAVSGAAH